MGVTTRAKRRRKQKARREFLRIQERQVKRVKQEAAIKREQYVRDYPNVPIEFGLNKVREEIIEVEKKKNTAPRHRKRKNLKKHDKRVKAKIKKKLINTIRKVKHKLKKRKRPKKKKN